MTRIAIVGCALVLLMCPYQRAAAQEHVSKVPHFRHVFVLVEENESYEDVIGNTDDMPYLNYLAEHYGLATNYFANTHPSINNYFYLTAGRQGTRAPFFGASADLYPFDVGGPNIASILAAHGKTWKSYDESLPDNGYVGWNTGDYVKRHNPFAFFETVRQSKDQRQNIVPFKQFKKDLERGEFPDYAFIAPNVYDDAHNDPDDHGVAPCGDHAALKKADKWLKDNIGPLINSPSMQDSLLVITFDEACDGGAHIDTRLTPKGPRGRGGGHVPTLLISPLINPGTKVDTLYHHESVLRLALEGLGIDVFPGRAAHAADMGTFFTGRRTTTTAQAP